MLRYPLRRPTRRRLTFQIFNAGIRFRLDAEGNPLPCANCRIGYFRNLWEPYCEICLADFERARESRKPDPVRPNHCARCRDPLVDGGDYCDDCSVLVAREAGDFQLLLWPPTRDPEPLITRLSASATLSMCHTEDDHA